MKYWGVSLLFVLFSSALWAYPCRFCGADDPVIHGIPEGESKVFHYYVPSCMTWFDLVTLTGKGYVEVDSIFLECG